MTQNAVVRARIDEQVKEDASIVLESIGLTPSDAFRMMMIRIAKEKALPFDPMTPNETTIKAIKAARSGQVHQVESIDQLMDELNADD